VRQAPRTAPTTGNLMTPPREPASVHGHWQPRPRAKPGRALLAAAGVVAAVALVAAARTAYARA